MHATINPNQCIGCTKCLTVCPPGAIIGSRRMVHGVITSNCHACGLCIPICPVNCITWAGEGSETQTSTSQLPRIPENRKSTIDHSTIDSPTPKPALPEALQARIQAAREASNTRYTQQRGPLNQPKALHNKQPKPK